MSRLSDSPAEVMLGRERAGIDHGCPHLTRMLSQAMRSVADAVSITDLEDNILFVNAAFCQLYGYRPEELAGRSITVVRSPKNPPELVREILPATLAGGWEGELWNCRRDGTDIRIHLRSTPVRSEQGEIVALVGVAQDVTERRRAEEELRDNQELLRTLAMAARDAIIMADENGRVFFWSSAAERIFGYRREDAIGRDVHELLAPPGYLEKAHRALALWRDCGQGNAVGATIELPARREDGSTFPVELSLASVWRKARWNAVAIVRDITERKRAEDQLRQTNQRLSALVERLQRAELQNSVMTEMRQFLQACANAGEIGPVTARSMLKLFPHSQGALFLLSPSRTDLENAASWGGFPADGEQDIFPPDACWGLRRGAALFVENPERDLVCPHLSSNISGAYACLPLVAKSDVLGLLHLRQNPAAREVQDAARMLAEIREISATLCELLSLSISNLQLRETLSYQAIRDPLTGLFNRRYMEEELQREIHRAQRTQQPLAVLMADVDHFKRFNDAYGHPAGDQVLEAIAGVLQSRTRGGDIVCRYGGEEFAVVLTDTNLEDAARRAEMMREEVRTLEVLHAGKSLGPVTISWGVAGFPEHAAKPGDLLRAADAALYQAKQMGRDRVVAARG